MSNDLLKLLKRCPFCGKHPQTVVDDETEEKFGVKCFNCGGSIYPEKATLQEAIDAWNSRSGLDQAISNTAYILDSLMALRNIQESGSCNDCGIEWACQMKPQLGRIVRYNCPFWVKQEGKQ